MRFPDIPTLATCALLTVTRPTHSGDGLGGHAPGEEETVFERRVDAQDAGAVADSIDEGECIAYAGSVQGIEPSDSATIRWDSGDRTEATVTQVRRLDNSLILSYD